MSDFIIINSIGLTAIILISFLYDKGKLNELLVASISMLFFINGLVHIAASIITASISPGTISGVLIYLPLGTVTLKKIFPFLSAQHRIFSIAFGLLIQIIIAIIALTI